jgi:DnaA family protein
VSQLPLGLVLRDRSTFETFFPAGNEQTVAFLRQFAVGSTQTVVWLAGRAHSGKTHLLTAACLAAGEAGRQAAYLSLAELVELGPDALTGWEQHDLLCLDDLDAVLGRADWEQAIFGLFNALQESGRQLLVAAPGGPRAFAFALPDLQSRLSWGGVFELVELDDEQRVPALALRARALGIELPEETGRYLLQRIPRDMSSLYRFLDTLDKESLAAQRRLTIPFVRTVLEQQTPESPATGVATTD